MQLIYQLLWYIPDFFKLKILTWDVPNLPRLCQTPLLYKAMEHGQRLHAVSVQVFPAAIENTTVLQAV